MDGPVCGRDREGQEDCVPGVPVGTPGVSGPTRRVRDVYTGPGPRGSDVETGETRSRTFRERTEHSPVSPELVVRVFEVECRD